MPKPKPRTQTKPQSRPDREASVSAAARRSAKPLGPEELDRARVVAARLAQEISVVLNRVQRSGASSLSLARDLSIDRHICHKLLSALDAEDDWIEMLVRMPGVPSLRTLIAAAAGTKKSHARDASAAIDHFEKLIWNLGGSQRKLIARLMASRDLVAVRAEQGVQGAESNNAKAELFHAASKVMGASADTLLSLWIVRPSQTPGLLESITIMGYIGLRCVHPSFPLVPITSSFTVSEAKDGLSPTNTGREIDQSEDEIPGLMREFSSKPLPPIATKVSPGLTMRIIETPVTLESGIDIVFRNHTGAPDPRRDPSPFQVIARRMRTPARHLLLDTFVHRSIRTNGVIRPYATYPQWNVMSGPNIPWNESLPGDLKVEWLGAGTEMARTPRWPRYPDLCAAAFNTSGWNPEEFIGWRCQTDYPYWGATYLVNFEFMA